MKIALITDTHWGVRNDNIAFIDNSKQFLSDLFFPTLEKEGIKTVVHLGDLVDRQCDRTLAVHPHGRISLGFPPSAALGIDQNLDGLFACHTQTLALDLSRVKRRGHFFS